MMRRTPLRSKRATPRRAAPERVQAVRQKPKAGAKPDAAERRHMARVAALPCIVSRVAAPAYPCAGRTTVHHVTSDGYARITRSHKRVINLCCAHHQIQDGPYGSVEALGHAGFTATYGIDLLAEADRIWKESEDENH